MATTENNVENVTKKLQEIEDDLKLNLTRDGKTVRQNIKNTLPTTKAKCVM